jgi:hypothetical protein
MKLPASSSRANDAALSIGLAAGVLILGPAIGVCLLWALGIEVSQAAGLAAVVVVGIAFILVVLAALSIAYPSGESTRDAFGLPDGSVRALLSLAILAAFIGVGVYIMGPVLSGEQQEAAAQQVIAALGTLLTAVAAFYFGTNSVKSGAAVFASVVGTPTGRGPEAITKGATDTAPFDLVGHVHPHGRETTYYFEYSEEPSPGAPSSYPTQTVPFGTVAAGDETVDVRHTLSGELPKGAWFRLVAFNEAGMSRGKDQQVKGR